MALVFSLAVTLAGVVVGLIANSGEMRYFGWFLAAIGALGLVGSVLVRTRRHR
jgi:predicted MFS family arabinose efflux permease